MTFMVIAMALLSSMDAMAKSLTMDGVEVMQILALRSCLIVTILATVFVFKGKSAELKPRSYKAHAGRGLVGFTAPLCFFYGITHIPLTDAVVIFFTSIFFVTLLSIVFLGEKVGVHRWASIVVGFLGVLIVVGPKGGGDITGYVLVLMGSIAYSILFTSSRYLSATESVPSLVLSFNVSVGAVSLLLLPWFWTELTQMHYARIAVLAVFALGGHYLITLAFSMAEASVLAPFEYTSVIWALIFDLLIWQISPALSTMIGAMIVIASGLYIVHREKIRSQIIESNQ
ncbi:MAG: DMT family transporter [Granulosicoccus sp.]